MATIQKIVLRGSPIRKEALNSAITYPGDLLQRDTSGYVKPHATAAGLASALFAVEEDFVGDEISDAYASGDRTQFVVCPAGVEIYALLASGQNVAIEAYLESAGNGSLRAATLSGRNIVAKALEAVNNTGGDAAGPHNNATRIKVEVI